MTWVRAAPWIESEWRERGACFDNAQAHRLLMPVVKQASAPISAELDARQGIALYCSECPVISECLDYALVTVQVYGVWGGKTAKQRRSIRRRLEYAS